MKVGIVGCGFIGHKRAKSVIACGSQVVACADIKQNAAEDFSQKFNHCAVYNDWKNLLSNPDIDIVIVATTHDVLAEITESAVAHKKHVLVEKPAAISAETLDPIILVSQKNNVCVHVGFDHRYHRTFRKAREIVDTGALGDLMFLRARYGHGARIGYEKEWRADPKLSGGGELIDQGVHLIDLARWFLGNFTEIEGFAHTYVWDMPVDDNGFLLLKTPKQQVAFLHASCTEWKNIFSFELYGKNGKIEVQGLGGSYGVERIIHYQMSNKMGPPETLIWEYPMENNSWEIEFSEFLDDIRLERQPSASLEDAKAALLVVENIYGKYMQ